MPYWVGVNVPLSIILIIYCVITGVSVVVTPKSLFLLNTAIILLLIICLNSQILLLKDIIKVVDFYISMSVLRKLKLSKLYFLPLLSFLLILAISIHQNLGELNENAVGSIILALVYLTTQHIQNVPKVKMSIISGLALFWDSLTTFMTSWVLIFGFRIHRLVFFYGGLISIVTISVSENILVASRILLGTLFVRFDIWLTSIDRFAALPMIDKLFGAPVVFERYFNQESYFSSFIFSGLDPHNIVILLLTKYGIFFTTFCLGILLIKGWSHSNRYILIWTIVALLEPSFSFNYLGVLAMMWNWRGNNENKS